MRTKIVFWARFWIRLLPIMAVGGFSVDIFAGTIADKADWHWHWHWQTWVVLAVAAAGMWLAKLMYQRFNRWIDAYFEGEE